MALLKDLWHFDQTQSPSLFYGSLNSLNEFYDTSQASPEILKQLQITGLKQAYANKGAAYQQLNNFLSQMLGSTQGTEEDLFAKLVQGINEGLEGFRSKENRINADWNKKEYYEKLDNIIIELNNLVNQVSGENGIPAPSLNGIKRAVGYHNFHDFIREKGEYLEQLGAWIMERAGLTGLATGAWQATDKFFGEESQKSIIEDAMGLLLDGTQQLNNSSNNFLTVSIRNYNKAGENAKAVMDKELQEWIDSIQELNGLKVLNGKVIVGTNISSTADFANLIRLINNNPIASIGLSVSLSDNLYQEIQKLSVNIQAKSNVERHLANKGKRSLYHINANDKYYSQLLRFSKTAPVKKKTAVTIEEQNTGYEEFVAYANYNLSKNILNTVYGRNEYYLTAEGFTDLATLMEKRNFYIRIENSVLSYQEFLKNSFRTIYQ